MLLKLVGLVLALSLVAPTPVPAPVPVPDELPAVPDYDCVLNSLGCAPNTTDDCESLEDGDCLDYNENDYNTPATHRTYPDTNGDLCICYSKK